MITMPFEAQFKPFIQTYLPFDFNTGQTDRLLPVMRIRSRTSFTFRGPPEYRSRTLSPGFQFLRQRAFRESYGPV